MDREEDREEAKSLTDDARKTIGIKQPEPKPSEGEPVESASPDEGLPAPEK